MKIDQCLHGYKNGHQLLASSEDFSVEEKRTLLYQSDLSGSNIQKGFEIYLTGYPLQTRNSYAFAKTWYATEMKRPGCVWTHTLLIDFSDLGGITDLGTLLKFFKRPEINNYDGYSIKLDVNLSEEGNEGFLKIGIINFLNNKLVKALYAFPTSPIILSADNAYEYEDEIIEIWNGQWPRLRRNFTFCSGSLSPKLFDEKPFDLQIISENNLSMFKRQMTECIEANEIDNKVLLETPINIVIPKHLKDFFWLFGSDVEGERKNFLHLLDLFFLIQKKEIKLDFLSEMLDEVFPEKDSAQLLKAKIFQKDGIIKNKIPEPQLLYYVSTSNNLSFLDISSLSLESRIAECFNTGICDQTWLTLIIFEAQKGRIKDTIWEFIDINKLDIYEVIQKDKDLFEKFIVKIPQLGLQQKTWTLDLDLQKTIFLHLLQISSSLNWVNYIKPILGAKSPILFEAKNHLGDIVNEICLEWLNSKNSNNNLPHDWVHKIIFSNEPYFLKWLQKKSYNVEPQIIAIIFKHIDIYKLQSIGISSNTWVDFYRKIKDNSHNPNPVFVSCGILSIGLNNKAFGYEWIVAEVFHDVYQYALAGQINSKSWGIIPMDDGKHNFDEETDFAYEFFSLLGINIKKKKHYVPSWDHCELLIRTVANKTLKYHWSTHAFLKILKHNDQFNRVTNYFLQFKKGKNYLKKVKIDIDDHKILGNHYQKQILNNLDI